jgi:hypothetical protein
MEPGRLQITFDCLDPARLRMFWAAALAYPAPDVEGWHNFLRSQGRSEEDLNATFAIEDPAGVRPRMFFQRVPEPKSVKNRVHLDLAAPAAGSSDRAEEIIGGDEATGRDPMWALILDVVVWSVIFGSSRCGRCGGPAWPVTVAARSGRLGVPEPVTPVS